MTLEYKGIDSVSGKKRYYDTASGEYSLGELPSASEIAAEVQDVSVEVKTSEKSPDVPVYTTNEINQAREVSDNADPAPNNKPDVAENKTPDKPSAQEIETTPQPQGAAGSGTANAPFKSNDKYLPAVEQNILHNYRSFTYNFAIGAITPEAVSNHKFLERDISAYSVLNSAGKGTKGVGISTQGLNQVKSDFEYTKKLVDEFNKNSAGRFDMFIDNVSIDSLIGAGSKQGGSSIATNITFDIFEPYSMNGFIEALQVAANAAGYNDYMKGAFVIRVQFQGYSDTATNAQMRAEVVPMSTRYFPITITEIGVEVNEQDRKSVV